MTVPTTDTLLTTLEVTANTAGPPEVGDTFTISLEPSFFTFFMDPFFNDIAFSSSPGTVTIIPEPSTLLILSILSGLAILGSVVRKRRG